MFSEGKTNFKRKENLIWSQSTASHGFVRTRSFHRTTFIRPGNKHKTERAETRRSSTWQRQSRARRLLTSSHSFLSWYISLYVYSPIYLIWKTRNPSSLYNKYSKTFRLEVGINIMTFTQVAFPSFNTPCYVCTNTKILAWRATKLLNI